MTTPVRKSLVILLHGVGSNGADLMGLGRLWAPQLPGAIFESPNAPERFDHGPGYQWFSITGVTEENRPARIAKARAAYDVLVSGLVARHGFAQSLDRVALAGFSQGSIMSLDAVASGRWPVAGLLAYSGKLATPAPRTPSLGTKVMLVHGSDDMVIPASDTAHAAAALKAAGVATEAHILRGIGHTISDDGVRLGQNFLSGLLRTS